MLFCVLKNGMILAIAIQSVHSWVRDPVSFKAPWIGKQVGIGNKILARSDFLVNRFFKYGDFDSGREVGPSRIEMDSASPEGLEIETQIKHQNVSCNGVRIHVASAGPEDGPLIIFLHGFPESWLSWKNQMVYFAQRGFRVLAPDQRGYNLSEKPQGIEHYNIDILAQDIVELLNWANRETAILAGHDWGAAVAWWISIHYPERLSQLIIVNLPHPTIMKKNLMRNLNQVKKSWYIFFFQIPNLPEWYLSQKNFQKLVDWILNTSRPGTFQAEDIEEYKKAWQQPDAIHSMVNWYRAGFRGRSQATEDLRVSSPTLIIWGDEDRFLSKEMAEQSLLLCKLGRLEWIHGSSHWVQHEESAKVCQLIHKFLIVDQPAVLLPEIEEGG